MAPDIADSPLPPILLTGDGVTLRPFDQRDLAVIAEAAGDDLIPKISTVPAPFTDDAGRDYIERQHQRLVSGAGWSLAIADADTDAALGQVGLWIGQVSKGRAEVGYWVAPSARGHGVAARAVMLLVDWAFAHLDVDRVSLFIESWNDASIRTAERAGFDREGVLRGWERVGGEPRDMVSFVRLRPTTAN